MSTLDSCISRISRIPCDLCPTMCKNPKSFLKHQRDIHGTRTELKSDQAREDSRSTRSMPAAVLPISQSGSKTLKRVKLKVQAPAQKQESESIDSGYKFEFPRCSKQYKNEKWLNTHVKNSKHVIPLNNHSSDTARNLYPMSRMRFVVRRSTTSCIALRKSPPRTRFWR